MDFPGLQNLYKDYKKTSGSAIVENQFGTLVMFFPSLLVVASDGVVDDEEKIYVKYLAKFMADTFKNEISPDERDSIEGSYLSDLEYLLDNLPDWEPKFIDTLKSYLETHEDAKEDIVDILYLFADASDGVSDDEEQKIEELKTILDLHDVEL
jgi:hypothetical protein